MMPETGGGCGAVALGGRAACARRCDVMLKVMDFVLEMMDFVLEMMGFALKVMDFVLKMMDLVLRSRSTSTTMRTSS